MDVTVIEQSYEGTTNFNYFLCSDLHFGNKAQNKKLLQSDFEKAKELDAKILINGDWGDFIQPSDRKRYVASGDTYGTDNHVNKTIEEAYKFLLPYSKQIVLIGTGNHEASQAKYNGIDVTQALIYMLNEKGGSIKHGQYSGFIRFLYRYKKGNFLPSKIMYYNHGQGGSAEISKGTIDLNRHFNSKLCDICWLGHKHTKIIMPCEPYLSITQKNDIYQVSRLGIITGCYLNNYGMYNAQKEGYKLSFGEERMRTLQGQGGVFLNHQVDSKKIEQNIMAGI